MMSRPSTSEKLSVARCGSRPRGWWPVILSDMLSMSIRIGKVARWWCQGWVTALGTVAIRIGKAVDGLQRGL